jgi:hypothetical protein
MININIQKDKPNCEEESMDKNIPKSYLGIVVMLGAVWGFSEAALGMWLRSCASLFSGSVMTGAALFFIAASWILTRRILGVALLILVASLFKMFDALLLSLPIQHGAVANPIFAFFMEGAAFLVLISIFTQKRKQKIGRQAVLGGMAALLAVNLFPLVKYATGIPACVVQGTGYPLSLYYAPLAVFISLVTVPLGFWAGVKIRTLETKLEESDQARKMKYLISPATLILCLAIITLIRLG